MRDSRGFTVMEVLAVLTILATAFALMVPRIMDANREGEARAFTQRLMIWADRVEGARPGLDYVDFTASTGVVPLAPAEWRTASNTLVHDYSGAATGENRLVSGVNSAGVALNTASIPRDACRSVLLQAHSRFLSVRVNTTWAKVSPATTLSPQTANTVCNLNRNSIHWVIL